MGIPVEYLVGLTVAAPFVATLLILVGPRRLAEAWGYVAAAISVTAAALLLPHVQAGDVIELLVLPLVPGLDLLFRIDPLGLTFALLASGLWIATGVYSSGYVRAEKLGNRRRYFAAFATSIGAAMGISFAGNLLTFFLFYELLTLATYPLVVHSESDEAFAAGRRYLLFALGSGLALLTAIVWTWQLTGTLDFTAGGFLQGQAPMVLTILFALFVTGVGVKSAVMPLHAWLPAAMVAPTPVSALLHAVAVVKAGVFGMIRVHGYVFGPETLATFDGANILAVLAGTTIVVGSLIAIRQDNLKRRLAYSTVVHLSYIVMGTALVAPLGMVGSMVHMVNHGLAKITLFFCAGAIMVAAHKSEISQLNGLGRRMPFTFLAFFLGALCVIGVPPMGGIWSKWHLVMGAYDGGQMVAVAVLLISTVLNVAYLLPPVVRAFLLPPPKADHGHGDGGETGHGAGHDEGHEDGGGRGGIREAPALCVVPLSLTALGCIALFFFAEPLFALLEGIFEYQAARP